MKILIVNTSDIVGGAARSAYRLHKALLDKNLDSKLLCNIKSSADYTITLVPNNIKKKILAKLAYYCDKLLLHKYKHHINTLFSANKYSTGDVLKAINAERADIVHLHWINYGMLTIKDICLV